MTLGHLFGPLTFSYKSSLTSFNGLIAFVYWYFVIENFIVHFIDLDFESRRKFKEQGHGSMANLILSIIY